MWLRACGESHLSGGFPGSVFFEVYRRFDLCTLAAFPRYAGLITLAGSGSHAAPIRVGHLQLMHCFILLRSTFPFFCLLFHPSFCVCVCVDVYMCVCVPAVVLTPALICTRHGAASRWRWHLLVSNRDELLIKIYRVRSRPLPLRGPPSLSIAT